MPSSSANRQRLPPGHNPSDEPEHPDFMGYIRYHGEDPNRTPPPPPPPIIDYDQEVRRLARVQEPGRRKARQRAAPYDAAAVNTTNTTTPSRSPFQNAAPNPERRQAAQASSDSTASESESSESIQPSIAEAIFAINSTLHLASEEALTQQRHTSSILASICNSLGVIREASVRSLQVQEALMASRSIGSTCHHTSAIQVQHLAEVLRQSGEQQLLAQRETQRVMHELQMMLDAGHLEGKEDVEHEKSS